MSKFPTIEYCSVTGLVKGRSAEQVHRFLADEAEMEGETMKAAIHRARADNLMEHPDAGIKSSDVLEAIAKWGRK